MYNMIQHWRNVVVLPTYFWDAKTQTLGLNGHWTRVLVHIEQFTLIKREMQDWALHLHLGDTFYASDLDIILSLVDLGRCEVEISEYNPYYELKDGVIVDRVYKRPLKDAEI